ncbi:MAG: hypothetical protein QOF35_2213 [Actinomycetota bacterium]|nr:hypothetical protein [Actinomycetota bacterium]
MDKFELMHARLSPVATVLSGGRRSVLLPLGTAAAALVAAGYVGSVDPNVAGHYPTCPFLAVTGWYCPGCGALRAVHALAHGDLVTALARNPFAVVTFGYVIIAWTLWLQRTVTGRPVRWMAPPWVLYGVLVAILLFAVLRNLPGWTWLSPA